MKRTLLIAGFLGLLGVLVGSCGKETPPSPGPAPPGFESPNATLPRGAMPPKPAEDAAENTKQATEGEAE